MGKKKQAEFITREEFDASLEEMDALNKAMDDINWHTQRVEYEKAETAWEDKRKLLQSRIDALSEHYVIQMISNATEYGINPSGALGEWITSWC